MALVGVDDLHELHMLQHLQESLLELEKISKPLTLVADKACVSRQLVKCLVAAGQPSVLPLRKNMVSNECIAGHQSGISNFANVG